MQLCGHKHENDTDIYCKIMSSHNIVVMQMRYLNSICYMKIYT